MQEKIINQKIINYDSILEVESIIRENFSDNYFLVRHNTYEKELVFKKAPTPFVRW
jgi:hypothetical protein